MVSSLRPLQTHGAPTPREMMLGGPLCAVAAAVFVVFAYGGGRSRSMAARSAASEGASLHHARHSSSILVAVLARQAVQKAQETSYASAYHYSTWTIYITNHANIPTVSVYVARAGFSIKNVGIRNGGFPSVVKPSLIFIQ